jgi:hypothetical protein
LRFFGFRASDFGFIYWRLARGMADSDPAVFSLDAEKNSEVFGEKSKEVI